MQRKGDERSFQPVQGMSEMDGRNLENSIFPEWREDDTHLRKEVVNKGVQYIGFRIHNEEFLIPMAPVREIIMLPTITYVPRAHIGVEGIIALRGEIMPVLNLRRILGFPRGKAENSTRVIIVNGELGGVGVIVDAITDFIWLQASDTENLEQSFSGSQYPFLKGVAKTSKSMRGIIDIVDVTSRFFMEKADA